MSRLRLCAQAVSDRRPVLERNLELRRVGQLCWHQKRRGHFGCSPEDDVVPLPKLVDAGLHPLKVVRPGPVGYSCEVHVDQEASGLGVAPAAMPTTPLAADVQAHDAMTPDVEGNQNFVTPTVPVVRQLQHRWARPHRRGRRPAARSRGRAVCHGHGGRRRGCEGKRRRL